MSTTWNTQKAGFQAQFDTLNSSSNVSSKVSQLNAAVNRYITTKADTDYNTIATFSQQLQTVKNNYATLNDQIITALKTDAQNNDLTGALTTNGSLQTQINNLEKRSKELQVEVDTALARDELLRSRDTDINSHQLFLLDRPVRKGMIPFLWALSVIFIGVGLVIYKMVLPPMGIDMGSTYGMEATLSDLLLNRTVLISLLVCMIIVIVVLSLKVGGVIGK